MKTDKEPIYIVSGYMRTGTSMMMKCLEQGGLSPVFSEHRESLNQKFGDKYYKPNEGGFYELTREQYNQIGFPRMYSGKLIKCLFGGTYRLVVHNYKIVFMMRDPEEIRQSYEAFTEEPAPPITKCYNEVMNDCIDILKNRKDTDVTVLQYRNVVDNPRDAFKLLKDNGWPINIDKAVAVVDEKLCRFRKENLTIGI